MDASNIFSLLNRFSPEEDRVTAGFAFLLAHDRHLLGTFLSRCGVRPTSKHVKVTIQTGHQHGSSRTDVELHDVGGFMVFIEAKIGRNPAHFRQLNKYARLLTRYRGEYEAVRLVVLTADLQEPRLARILPRLPLALKEIHCLRWKEIQRLVETVTLRKNRDLVKMFTSYLGDAMSDRRFVRDQLVGEICEVLVLQAKEKWWKVNTRHHFATMPHMYQDGTYARPPPDAQYVAFYRNKPISAITHVAKVDHIDDLVSSRKLYQRTYLAKEASRFTNLDKVYYFGRLARLPCPIPKGAAPFRGFRKTSFERLLRAKSTDEL